MDKFGRDAWATLGGSEVHRMERIGDSSSPSGHTDTDFSQIDFSQGEKIEMTGKIDPAQYTNFQYFSSREEFEDRLSALMSWAGKSNPNTMYGIVSISKNIPDQNKNSIDSVEEAIAAFEDFFIKNIRVPRKYTPPVASDCKRRKSDNPGYKNIRGNFDLVCRTPSTEENPHMIEFVLYDCGYYNVRKKIKTFKKFARNLGLSIEIEISRCERQKCGK